MDGETQDETASDAASTMLPAPRSEISEPPLALASALKAIARLNRNTTWVATGLLGSVIFAAVMVAVRDPHPETDDVTDFSQHFKSDLLPNVNPAADFSVAGSTEKSAGEIPSGQAANVDSGITSLTNHDRPAVLAIASSYSPAPRPDFVRDARPKIPNLRHRSTMRSRNVTFKLRLIALWYRSLVRNESSRRRTPSSKWKKVNYAKRTVDTLKGNE
jgi:hypothetical protein